MSQTLLTCGLSNKPSCEWRVQLLRTGKCKFSESSLRECKFHFEEYSDAACRRFANLKLSNLASLPGMPESGTGVWLRRSSTVSGLISVLKANICTMNRLKFIAMAPKKSASQNCWMLLIMVRWLMNHQTMLTTLLMANMLGASWRWIGAWHDYEVQAIH